MSERNEKDIRVCGYCGKSLPEGHAVVMYLEMTKEEESRIRAMMERQYGTIAHGDALIEETCEEEFYCDQSHLVLTWLREFELDELPEAEGVIDLVREEWKSFGKGRTES